MASSTNTPSTTTTSQPNQSRDWQSSDVFQLKGMWPPQGRATRLPTDKFFGYPSMSLSCVQHFPDTYLPVPPQGPTLRSRLGHDACRRYMREQMERLGKDEVRQQMALHARTQAMRDLRKRNGRHGHKKRGGRARPWVETPCLPPVEMDMTSDSTSSAASAGGVGCFVPRAGERVSAKNIPKIVVTTPEGETMCLEDPNVYVEYVCFASFLFLPSLWSKYLSMIGIADGIMGLAVETSSFAVARSTIEKTAMTPSRLLLATRRFSLGHSNKPWAESQSVFVSNLLPRNRTLSVRVSRINFAMEDVKKRSNLPTSCGNAAKNLKV